MPPERSLFAFTTRRPVAITMVVVAVCVFGLVGLFRLPVNLLPDISYPTVTVRTEYLGASPRDVEERLSEKVQELVAVVPGARRVYSISRAGVSDVVLEFAWGTQMTFAVADVRERLDRFFPPPGAGKPLVLRYDPSLDPVMTLGLVATTDAVDTVALRRYADLELEEQLAQVPGVAAVRLRGGDEEEIRIAIDEQALTARNLDVALVAQRLRAENMNAAAGAIEESRTEFLVRALNEYRSLEEIRDTVLVEREGAVIRLGEVARVTRVPADPEVIARLGGRPAVLVDLYKEADANIVELCRNVRQRTLGTERQQQGVAQGLHTAPLSEKAEADPLVRQAELRARRLLTEYLAFDLRKQGMDVQLLQDQSQFIQSAIDEVLANAVQGGALSILVIFFFLRSLVTTAILAASIPISLVATFAPMFMTGVDINIMSLGGLALGVGMLVDNSIVVLESIAKARESGMAPAQAAVAGTSRVAGAVVASTLTTVAVFFPIVFVEGLAGQLFRDQSLTVVFSLLMSLLAAMFLVPMLASRSLSHEPVASTMLAAGPRWIVEGMPRGGSAVARAAGWLGWLVGLPFRMVGFAIVWLRIGAWWTVLRAGWLAGKALGLVLTPLAKGWNAAFGTVERAYPPLLRAALARPGTVLLVTAVLVGASVHGARNLGQTVLPEVHQGEFWVEAFLPRSATVQATDEVLRRLEQHIAALPEVASTFVASGVDPEELNDSEEGKHSGRVLVRLRPAQQRSVQEEAVRDAIGRLVAEAPEVLSHRFAITSVLQFQGGLVVEVLGHDLVALRRACEQVNAALAAIPSLRDVRSTLQRGNPELTVRLDRDQLASLDLDAQAVANVLRAKVLGDVPTLFNERERKIDMRVRIDRAELDSETRLRQLNVNPQGYPEIPLGSVATIERVEGPSEIRRLGNVRGAEVQADVFGFDVGRTELMVEAAVADLALPRGIEARIGGQKEELEASQRSLVLALGLALFLVYVVMASQFESLLQPLIVLVTVPLAMVGVVGALLATGTDVSVIVLLGAIVLAGIVVNNAIVLIDQVNQLHREGMPLQEAIVQGARDRLRPVLMTTLTTLLGLLPQTGWLLGVPWIGGSSDGLELRAPMAVTVIGGLSSSTLLTLVLVPVICRLAMRSRQ